MDQFPQELVDRISRYLSHDDLKSTLVLSNSFRFAAEKYSGAFCAFALNEDNAEKFVDTFSGHRLLYLRSLEFWTRLPRVEYRHPPLRGNADQLSENDTSFTRQIKFLFKTLKKVEERAGNQNKPGRIELTIYAPQRPVAHAYQPLSYHHFLSWRVHLLEPAALPSLESIRSLEIKEGSLQSDETNDADYSLEPVKLDYRVMVDLVVNFPNLEYWGCQIGGDEWTPKWQREATDYLMRDWAGPRRDTRQDFAKALESARLPNSLRRIRLDFLHHLHDAMRVDHHTKQPDLVKPAHYDLFSNSLHHLSQHLRRLHLRVVADETLFWPKNGCITSWPNLESLVVMFHMVSPSGKWYFEGPKGVGCDTAAFEVTNASYPPLETTDYDEEMRQRIESEGDRRSEDNNVRFRIVPNDTTLRPFLAAFANAASNMIALKEAALWCPLAWEPDYDDPIEVEDGWLPDNTLDEQSLAWGVYYIAPGERDYTQPEGPPSETPQLWWRVAKWRPDPELHELFQQIGRKPWGDSQKEHWEDDEYGDGLVDRDYFESYIQEEVDSLGRIPVLN